MGRKGRGEDEEGLRGGGEEEVFDGRVEDGGVGGGVGSVEEVGEGGEWESGGEAVNEGGELSGSGVGESDEDEGQEMEEDSY